jgi:ABC-type lipoprotein export system ATPase subunit
MRVELKSVMKSFRGAAGSVRVLDGVDLIVEDGGLAFVTGPSGSGKSTLLGLIGLLDTPDSGDVILGGSRAEPSDARALALIRGKRIGHIRQSGNLITRLSVLDNLLLPFYAGRLWRRKREEALSILDGMGLSSLTLKRPHEISGGEAQRAAAARALLKGADLVLADEPTGNLDAGGAESLMEAFRKFRAERGTTIIVVTHNLALARPGERVLALSGGRLHEEL